MESKPLSTPAKLALTALTLFIAATPPMTMLLAWLRPDAAPLLGWPVLRSLPAVTILIAVVIVLLQSALMILVVARTWKVVTCFGKGIFFSRTVVTSIRSIGINLLVIAVLRLLATPVAIASIWMAGRLDRTDGLWTQLFNLPAGTALCGLVGLVVAGAFDRAARMAHDARYTV